MRDFDGVFQMTCLANFLHITVDARGEFRERIEGFLSKGRVK